jgi:hypothetical protein
VAGGLVAGNALMSLFSGSHSYGGGFGGGYGAPGGGPWGSAPADQGYVDQGTWTDPSGGGSTDPGYVDNGTWDTSGDNQSSWTDNSSDGDSGFDSGGGSTDDTF